MKALSGDGTTAISHGTELFCSQRAPGTASAVYTLLLVASCLAAATLTGGREDGGTQENLLEEASATQKHCCCFIERLFRRLNSTLYFVDYSPLLSRPRRNPPLSSSRSSAAAMGFLQSSN